MENAKLFLFRFVTNKLVQIVLPYINRNTESFVLNNGWASNHFTPERGVRQGCPLSPYIFIFCAEILAKNVKIQNGVTVCGNELKISQYADDTTTILDGSKESFTSALLDLELSGAISGLWLNNKETEAGRQCWASR